MSVLYLLSFLIVTANAFHHRPVSHSRFSPTPADSVLSRCQALVKPPKNLQAIASQKTRQPLAFH